MCTHLQAAPACLRPYQEIARRSIVSFQILVHCVKVVIFVRIWFCEFCKSTSNHELNHSWKYTFYVYVYGRKPHNVNENPPKWIGSKLAIHEYICISIYLENSHFYRVYCNALVVYLWYWKWNLLAGTFPVWKHINLNWWLWQNFLNTKSSYLTFRPIFTLEMSYILK